MELTWIITLGWVTGGGKSLGIAMWLLVPVDRCGVEPSIDLPQTLDIREEPEGYRIAYRNILSRLDASRRRFREWQLFNLSIKDSPSKL
jgi:hypothetical protein